MPEFDPSMLPPRPTLIPDELRQFTADNTMGDWSTRVPPAAVGMFVAAVVQWLSHPRFGVRVHVDARDDGWTLDIALPRPETRDDVISLPT